MATISEVEMFIKSLGANFDETVADGNLLKAINKMDDASGVYAASWVEKNQGQTYDKSKGKAAGAGKAFAGGSASAAPAAKASASLFD